MRAAIRRWDVRPPRCPVTHGIRHIAIDMWSSGIIFLFFLTRKFPLFQSNDDVEALMELSTIIGRKGMERTATLHSAYDIFLRALSVQLLS